MALNVRPLGQYIDIEAIMVMARAMHEESPRYRDMPFSEDKARSLIQNLFDNSGGFVADLDGEIIGMAGGAVVEHFFSPVRFAVDFVVYVKPEHRGSSAGIRLIKAFEDWAFNEMGAEEIQLGVSTGIHQEKTVGIYKKMGYDTVSQHMLKKKKVGNHV